MDISVKHLNGRMALQIPTEFPLGLVFVVGDVKVDPVQDVEEPLREFYLHDDDSYLLCRLTSRVSEEILVHKGDQIRASGHIVFDMTSARFCLLARDVEILKEYKPPSSTLGEIVARSSHRTPPDMAPAILPQWVRELAPPEIQEEWAARRIAEAGGTLVITGKSLATAKEESPVEPVAAENWQELMSDDDSLNYAAGEVPLTELSDELIEFLSEAIDSHDIIELTPAVLAEYEPEDQEVEEPVSEDESQPEIDQETVVPGSEEVTETQVSSIEEFLTALETAIAADEAQIDKPDQGAVDIDEPPSVAAPDLEPDASVDPSPHPDPDTDVVDDSLATDDEPSQPDPQPKPVTTPVKPAKSIPWFIYALIFIAGLLLLAIFLAMAFGPGIIGLATSPGLLL